MTLRFIVSLFSNVDAKRTPEYNLLVDGQFNHKDTYTKVDVKVRHGEDVKVKANKEKELHLTGLVHHTIKNPKALVKVEVKAVYPDKVSPLLA
jgi:hypothetical protein